MARLVTFSMGTSADGFVMGPDGGFAWATPDPAVFQLHLDELRGTGVQLLGRRLYEAMLYWETTADKPELDAAELEWAAGWTALPKTVFSRTLTAVQGSYRLATTGLAEEVARLRAAPGEGDIAVGGAELAAQAAELDLIDEYRVFVHPVVVGGGTPYFARHGRQVALDLVESRPFPSGVVFLRYRVRHEASS